MTKPLYLIEGNLTKAQWRTIHEGLAVYCMHVPLETEALGLVSQWDVAYEHYGNLLGLGYKFQCNAPLDRLDENVERLEATGLEVEVCETTIDVKGNIVPNKHLFAVFARESNKDTESGEK